MHAHRRGRPIRPALGLTAARLPVAFLALFAALALVAAAVAVVAPQAPASAAPAPRNPDDASDEEGSDTEVRKQLEDASRGFIDAQNALENSKKRQAELTAQLHDAESLLAVATPRANEIVSAVYRTGGSMHAVSVLLASESPSGFVDRAARLRVVATRNDRQLRDLAGLRSRLADGKAAIDAEVAKQEQQLALMAKRKQDAERALAAYGGGQPERGPESSSGGGRSAGPPAAAPAPRRGDGSWPPESCRLDDPTTGGCITPRTLHALQQARGAGFTRFVSCFRAGGRGEHPRGRACDWSAQQSGFGGVATGGDRAYGNNLASYFLANARRLGVLYVIWFRQIWLPSSGWRAYRGGRGDPSSDHTNHLHLSMY